MANDLLAGKTILLVEDEMLIMMLAEDYLHQLGCTSILVAGTTRQALEAIADHDIDAAMLDMNLHGETSDAVADALSDKGVPFLFVTGYVGPSLFRTTCSSVRFEQALWSQSVERPICGPVV